MSLFRNKNKSISRKLLLLVMGVTTCALIIANIIALISEYATMRYRAQNHLNYFADIAGRTLQSYEINNAEDQILNFIVSLQFDLYLDKSCYYDQDNRLLTSYVSVTAFQEYGNKAYCPEKSSGIADKKDDLFHLYKTVKITGTTPSHNGLLFIKYDLGKDIEYFIQKEIINILTIGIALIFAYFLSIPSKKKILKPIYSLASIASTIVEKNDYSLRAKKYEDDELGILSEAFNEMLSRIEARDKKLVESAEIAKRANAMKSEFLAVMSHEIRTPMNGIVGTADLLAETKLNKQQQKYTSIIVRSAQTLLDLIKDILDFSKIEAGKLEIEKTAFDITDHIQDVIDMVGVTAREKGLKLNFINNLQENYTIIGDPVRLKQVILNLTSNAIKFTPEGSITLTLDEDPYTPAINNIKQIWISVADTGIGIPLDRQEGIFDTFSQADSSTTRKFGGSGLGLAICKSLTELMGGTIAVKSLPQAGSVFWLSIPFQLTEKNIDTQGIALSSDDLSPNDDKRILLVEDNPTNTMITEQILKNEGFYVTCCKNGQEAVDAYAKDVYPRILMDCHMPVMDGFEATQKIRNFEEEHDLPRAKIFALTASALSGDREKCIAAGMDDYITKPFRKADFVKKIKESYR